MELNCDCGFEEFEPFEDVVLAILLIRALKLRSPWAIGCMLTGIMEIGASKRKEARRPKLRVGFLRPFLLPKVESQGAESEAVRPESSRM